MTLSIIVPVYNAAAYLDRCINSILSQGLNAGEYEILLINDGSKDNSLDICKRYQDQHSSIIKVFSQENKGVAISRNKGIKEAKGDYICFVDADDYLIPNGYRYLINNYLDTSVDILSFWSLTLDKKTKQSFMEDNNVKGEICYETKGIDFLKRGIQTFIFTSIYKHNFLLSNQLLFRPNMVIAEDVLFSLNVYLRNPKIRMVSSRLYRYDLHEESVIHQRDPKFMRKAIDSYMVLMQELAKETQENSENLQLCEGLHNIAESQCVPFISRILSSDYSISEFKQIRQKLTNKGILPLKRKNKTNLLIQCIFNTPYCIQIYEWGYQKVFIPYILPRLSRN